MASLVWTSDEEPRLVVAKYIAELAWADGGKDVAGEVASFCDEAERLLSDSDRVMDFIKLLLTSSDLVLTKASEKDAECVFAVISSFVPKATPGLDRALVGEISAKLLAKPQERPALRMKLLISLYNLVRNPAIQFQLYMDMLNFATAAKVTELIVPSFKRLDALIREWGRGPKEQRALFLAVSNILKETKGSSRESFSYLLKYLGTFSVEEGPALAAAKDDAARAVVEFVRAPDLFQSDLLDLPSVRQLSKDRKHGPLYTLLEIFLTQYLDDYIKFQSKNAEFLEAAGLVHEDCVTKMRLLSLAALATEGRRGGLGEVRYSQISETLQIPLSEVDTWVVRAISAKVIEAKMDQMRQVVIVSRSTQRVFGPAQWKELQGRITRWKENLSNVSKIIQNVQASNGGLLAPRGP
eukprot:TRINITY_DN36384_c0_g1_i1.p1 TRINITY_DN36384_c0_g1~~TRINITY_DN36384_c0_g1_i1.p1  ORF type:complete len:411 (+),score=86.82 TRINITY_DN36384_c0_g1_i1:191-1423(+)